MSEWIAERRSTWLESTPNWSDSTCRYGSHAKGTAHPDSDIDVAVVVERVDGDYLDALASLFRLRREVDLRIEPVLIEQGNDKSGFLSEIMATGYVVYESAH
jgi:predicted nucleotidyltransferase